MANLKITTTSLEALRERIAPLDTDANRQAYREGRFVRSDKVKDLDRRYRWDLLWATCAGPFVSDLYAEGLNDSHIDSALKAVVPAL